MGKKDCCRAVFFITHKCRHAAATHRGTESPAGRIMKLMDVAGNRDCGNEDENERLRNADEIV